MTNTKEMGNECHLRQGELNEYIIGEVRRVQPWGMRQVKYEKDQVQKYALLC